MPTFRTALANLSQLAVTGVAHNYDVDAVPDTLARAQLPALLVLPGETQDNRLFREGGAAFQAIAFSSGGRTVTYTVSHLLLVAPVSGGTGMRSHLPTLITLVDNYVAALAANVTLSAALLEPARVQVEPGVFRHGETHYHGCAFRHTWLIQV